MKARAPRLLVLGWVTALAGDLAPRPALATNIQNHLQGGVTTTKSLPNSAQDPRDCLTNLNADDKRELEAFRQALIAKQGVPSDAQIKAVLKKYDGRLSDRAKRAAIALLNGFRFDAIALTRVQEPRLDGQVEAWRKRLFEMKNSVNSFALLTGQVGTWIGDFSKETEKLFAAINASSLPVAVKGNLKQELRTAVRQFDAHVKAQIPGAKIQGEALVEGVGFAGEMISSSLLMLGAELMSAGLATSANVAIAVDKAAKAKRFASLAEKAYRSLSVAAKVGGSATAFMSATSLNRAHNRSKGLNERFLCEFADTHANSQAYSTGFQAAVLAVGLQGAISAISAPLIQKVVTQGLMGGMLAMGGVSAKEHMDQAAELRRAPSTPANPNAVADAESRMGEDMANILPTVGSLGQSLKRVSGLYQKAATAPKVEEVGTHTPVRGQLSGRQVAALPRQASGQLKVQRGPAQATSTPATAKPAEYVSAKPVYKRYAQPKTTLAQQEAFARAAAGQDPKAGAFYVSDNRILKQMNDDKRILGSQTAADEIEHAYQAIFQKNLEASKLAKHVYIPYFDPKSTRLVFQKGKSVQELLPDIHELEKKTARDFERWLAASPYGKKMLSPEVIALVGRPGQWHVGGIETDFDRANFVARQARGVDRSAGNPHREGRDRREDKSSDPSQDGGPTLARSLRDGEAEQMLHRVNTEREAVQQIQRTHTRKGWWGAKSGPMVNQDGSLSLKANAIVRKSENAKLPNGTKMNQDAYIQREFQRAFNVKLSAPEAKQIRSYYEVTDKFSPAMVKVDGKPILLGAAKDGIFSWDGANLGPNNAVAVQSALAKNDLHFGPAGSDAKFAGAFRGARQGVDGVTDTLNDKMNILDKKNVAMNPSLNVKRDTIRAGDDYFAMPDSPFQRLRRQFSESIDDYTKEAPKILKNGEKPTDRFALTSTRYLEGGRVPDAALSAADMTTRRLEKQLRENLAKVAPKLNVDAPIGVTFIPSQKGGGRASLVLPAGLSPQQKAQLDEYFLYTLDALGKKEGVRYGWASTYYHPTDSLVAAYRAMGMAITESERRPASRYQ